MDKRIVLITGGNSGIGKAAALQFAVLGHTVVIGCRSKQRGSAALADIKAQTGSDDAHLMVVDMSLKVSIRQFAAAFKKKFGRLDVLIHNAATFDISQKQPIKTEEGVESIWATNHIGPVLLTECLMDVLKKSDAARILTVASKGLVVKKGVRVDMDDPEFDNRRFSVQNAYYQSKRAQVMYTYWLAGQLGGTGLTVNCVRVTNVQLDISRWPNVSDFMKKIYKLKSRFAISPEQMAGTYVYLALSSETAGETGKYFDENNAPVRSIPYTYERKNIEALMALTKKYLD